MVKKLHKLLEVFISLRRGRKRISFGGENVVTAIVIPIICIYFYLIAKKEMHESLLKWQALKNIPEETVISGKIVQVSGHKQRFSYYRFVYVLDLTIQTELKKLQLKKVIPMDQEFEV